MSATFNKETNLTVQKEIIILKNSHESEEEDILP